MKQKIKHTRPTGFAARVMYVIRRSRDYEIEYFATLGENSRSAVGTMENWAPKDLLAHLTYWRRRAVEAVSYMSRGQNPPEYPSTEEANRLNFIECRNMSFLTLTREAETVMEAIQLIVERFSQEELQKIGFHAQIPDRSLLGYLLYKCYIHPVYHLSLAYLRLGKLSAVNRLQDAMVKDVLSLDDSPNSRAVVYYDRACFYALTGQKDRALTALTESLVNRPELKVQARDDSDLVSLQDNPQFQELVAD